MKEFRIARCISEDGKSVRRYAIFKDRSNKQPIEVDDNGREYFSIDNWIQSDPEMDQFNHGSLAKRLKYSFVGKPKDMVDSIANGYGDALYSNNFMGCRLEGVVYYLDREYGEMLREKTLEGWKDAVYKYVLYFNCIPLDVNSGRKDYNRVNIYFDTAKDAIAMAERLINDSITLAGKLEGHRVDEDIIDKTFGCYVEHPVEDLTFRQFRDIHEYGDIFTKNPKVSKRLLENMFTIIQEPINN